MLNEAGPSVETGMITHRIRSTKERVWLLEYAENDSKALQALKWTWTLEWTRATTYPTVEAAMARLMELGATDAYVETHEKSGPLWSS